MTERIMLVPKAVRHLIEPGEVPRYAAFLDSDDTASMNGTAPPIARGWTARKDL